MDWSANGLPSDTFKITGNGTSDDLSR
jgi:hypothetical protein